MKLLENYGVAQIQVSHGAALFKEELGMRYLIAIAPPMPGIIQELKSKIPRDETGRYFIADKGTYAINDLISAKIMVDFYNEEVSA